MAENISIVRTFSGSEREGVRGVGGAGSPEQEPLALPQHETGSDGVRRGGRAQAILRHCTGAN